MATSKFQVGDMVRFFTPRISDLALSCMSNPVAGWNMDMDTIIHSGRTDRISSVSVATSGAHWYRTESNRFLWPECVFVLVSKSENDQVAEELLRKTKQAIVKVTWKKESLLAATMSSAVKWYLKASGGRNTSSSSESMASCPLCLSTNDFSRTVTKDSCKQCPIFDLEVYSKDNGEICCAEYVTWSKNPTPENAMKVAHRIAQAAVLLMDAPKVPQAPNPCGQ